MGFMGTLWSSLVPLRVVGFDKILNSYKSVQGLDETHLGGWGCLKAYDEFDHHSLMLRLVDEIGLVF